MPTESPRPLVQQLLRVVLGTSDVSDRDLLARFIASRDEDAFAEIARRHGPMVLAVCRRVTGRPHDAEDAFQAAFLVLARRAAHISRPELLANWLYGVAYRTALEARAARRRVEDHVVPAAPEPAAPPPMNDVTELRRVLDEELAKLPDKYRTAVVLCDLEGLPRATAATQMGIPEGTLSSRLAHARKVLADRLTRRGVTASATIIAAALGRDNVATAVPHNLMNITISAAVRFVPGGGVPLGISPTVSSITDGVLKTMLATRLRQLFAVGLLTCGLIGVGGALAQQLHVTTSQNPNSPPLVVTYDAETGTTTQEPATQPKKIAAKGIEDDDVPYASFPSQAVVRLEDGKLIVRQRSQSMRAAPVKLGNQTVTRYDRVSSVHASMHDPADVAIFDIKGNRMSPKAWKELLKSDVHALVSYEGKLPNPRELTLFKQDTLVVVLPTNSYWPATNGAHTYYAPTQSGLVPPPPAAVPPGYNTAPVFPSTTPFTQPVPSGTSVLPTPVGNSLAPLATPGTRVVPSSTIPASRNHATPQPTAQPKPEPIPTPQSM